jgi:nucleotide-binding universal stress UspA family protein
MAEEDKQEGALRRILVALDAASFSASALESAAELAARLEAELCGIFVEDIDLLRSAALPFVREYSLTSAGGTEFDMESVERELKLLAARARRALEAAAARTRVRHSFAVVRGQLAATLAAASTGIDLVVLQGSCRPLARHLRLGAPGRSAAFGIASSVLLLEPGSRLPRTVFVVFDEGEAGSKTLAIAARLALVADGELVVLLGAADAREQARLELAVRDALAHQAVNIRVEAVPAHDLEALRMRAHGGHPGLLVLAARSPRFTEAERERLIDALGCPLLLVR